MNKNIKSKILILVLVVVVATFMLTGCSAKEVKENVFPTLTNEELNFSHLEVKGDKLALVENRESDFCVVYSMGSSNSLDRAVNEMVNIIYSMSGAELPIVATLPIGKKAIYIVDELTDDVVNDGTKIAIDTSVTISGKDYTAKRNGIYVFLEEYLGVMFVSPTETFVPKHSSIYLDKGVTVHNPSTEWRDVMSIEIGDNYWSSKLKLNSIDVERTDEEILEEFRQKGVKITNEKLQIFVHGRQRIDWGNWCHSMYSYVSPSEYFEQHPEYFSLKNGKRVYQYNGMKAHLCLSNPEVYNIVEAKLAKLIEEHPEKKYWDFSCNDNYWVRGCECKQCKELDKQAGGTGMGTLLPFINKLAKRFPDKYISTLAYFHTIKPPTNIKAEPNVVIKLCSMPGDQASSYLNPTNKNAQDFKDFIADWKKVTDKIIIWDYVVNFKNLLVPFPNFAVQQENQEFFEKNNVQGVFHQASREVGGESSTLRSYILSKLLWKGSSLDVSKEVSRYLYAYYGSSYKYVLEYYNLLQQNLTKYDTNLGLYDNNMSHFAGYLSKDNIYSYDKIISTAIDNASSDSEKAKLEDLKLNITYAKMLLPNITIRERQQAKATFDRLVEEKNITMVTEQDSLEKFNKGFNTKVFVNELIVYSPVLVIVLLLTILLVSYLICKKVKSKKNKISEKRDI